MFFVLLQPNLSKKCFLPLFIVLTKPWLWISVATHSWSRMLSEKITSISGWTVGRSWVPSGMVKWYHMISTWIWLCLVMRIYRRLAKSWRRLNQMDTLWGTMDFKIILNTVQIKIWDIFESLGVFNGLFSHCARPTNAINYATITNPGSLPIQFYKIIWIARANLQFREKNTFALHISSFCLLTRKKK